ncbi:hypothetical protein TESG_08636 [Trichophyton tonsurans CBS 112818]|uniref:Uncharacterized protein n=1 Tax=Trichophyton tonsurans (strain CBS 112818) TaxID=647933 RepID=F2S9F1_TRIT1|nr:hypothetical protein TESG_08636 [Trichophyton tonsurans CBS 112818]
MTALHVQAFPNHFPESPVQPLKELEITIYRNRSNGLLLHYLASTLYCVVKLQAKRREQEQEGKLAPPSWPVGLRLIMASRLEIEMAEGKADRVALHGGFSHQTADNGTYT